MGNSNGLRFKNTPSKTIWVHCVLFDSEPCQPNFSGFNTTCWIRMNSRKYLVVQLCQSNWKCFKSISSLFHAYGTKEQKVFKRTAFITRKIIFSLLLITYDKSLQITYFRKVLSMDFQNQIAASIATFSSFRSFQNCC